MIGTVSKGLALSARCSKLFSPGKIIVRNAGGPVFYRAPPKKGQIPMSYTYAAEGFGGLLWWWILYRTWHDWEHLFFGDGLTPDPSLWTDAELGIPADDED